MRIKHSLSALTFSVLFAAGHALAADIPEIKRSVRIGDISTVEGVRDNPLVGYGLVAGLNGTGDRQQTVFSMQTLASILKKMGVQAPAAVIVARNVASVFVTASLPPFARPGTQIDVNVASTGDAKSLEGGVLLLTPLYGPDGQPYAVAQGPLVLGGYTGGGRMGTGVTVNHPTTGRIPAGALVERDTSVDLSRMQKVNLLLRESDFTTAQNAATAINSSLKKSVATAVDGRRVEIVMAGVSGQTVPDLLALIEDLPITVHERAKVVVNERTGTVVLGRNVSLGAASILHGNLAVEITTVYQVSQPAPLSNTGQTKIVPQTTVQTQESPAHKVELKEGATVEDLVNGLQAIGATARDIIAILEALRDAGSLQAQLQVI